MHWKQVVTELNDARYFSVRSDASNVGNIKAYPYAVQYFSTETAGFWWWSIWIVQGYIWKNQETNDHLIKANCNYHIINNCVKYALKALSVDIESVIIKTLNEFSSSSTRTEKLKECFLFVWVEYKNLRHVPTRWLSLLPGLDRLLHYWPTVKQYSLIKGKMNVERKYGNLYLKVLLILTTQQWRSWRM